MTTKTNNREKLVANKALCLHCDEVVESKHRHDYVMCSCRSIGVDGGTDYIRRIGDPSDYVDMCVYANTHEGYRENLRWGKNYDKDMNMLPETEWMLIKDMTTDHIEAILEGGYANGNDFYVEIFNNELKFRKNEKLH